GAVVAPVSRTLVQALVFIESKVGNYGIAILLITFCIRLLIWPLHAKSTRTMKKMAALSPKMTAMREEFKDDPQRLNKEMMTLYKDYGVNPFGGCFPVFLQLPIFLGFYRMLQSAVELRHRSFLWVEDLSMPDTLFTIPLMGGLPFNVLPLLMGVTMLIQMKVAPKSGDKTQQRIFMFMPLIFLFICYNFASALALYWTAQNIFSIGQTWYMSRRPEPELVKKTASESSIKGMMEKAKDRTKVSGQGPQHTKSKTHRKKRRR
ncbi:MAG: membrane protein insertase YidC, partial [Verrucomicrobiales bacterium]